MRQRGSSARSEKIEVVDLHGQRDEDLVRAFHHRVYSAAFPIKSERESVDTWLGLLSGADTSCELHFLVAGHDLGDPYRRAVLAGHLLEYYPDSGCGLLTYLVTHPRHRGQGLATRLLDRGLATLKATARRRRRRLRLVFAEVNDPRKIRRPRDVMDPWERLRFFERRGGRILDFPYVQPELEPGQGPERNLLLLLMTPSPNHRTSVAAAPIRRFLHEFYRAVNIPRPEMDADFQKMMVAIRSGRVGFTRVSTGGRTVRSSPRRR
jgi:GNAT superfamily N-acetyltransferase